MTARQSPSEHLDKLREGGFIPGDRELQLATVVALSDIADSLREIAGCLAGIEMGLAGYGASP